MTNTITVTCGLRQGLRLRTYDLRDVEGMKKALPDDGEIALQYGENPGVDKAQFDKWMEANKDSDIVRSSLVFVAPAMPEEGRAPLKSSADETARMAASEKERADLAEMEADDLRKENERLRQAGAQGVGA